MNDHAQNMGQGGRGDSQPQGIPHVAATGDTQVTVEVTEGVGVITAQPDAIATLDDDTDVGVIATAQVSDTTTHRTRAWDWKSVYRRLLGEQRWTPVIATKDRMIGEARDRGMSPEAARDWAYAQLDRMYPPLALTVAPTALEEPKPPTIDSSRLQGLGDVPAAWGDLPDNASLAAEIGWCQANRLRVVEERTSNLTVVHLDRARTPAPSWAALGWLETSIRSYAKFVDVASKCMGAETDEAQHVRRELIAIEDIRALLDEMHRD